ncbi:MAG TPA: hypothetical protein VF375_10565 [Candidatus Limnocylindrales bacterium]
MRRFIALVLIGTVALAACGSAAKSTEPGAASAPASSQAAAGAPVSGDCPASGYTEGTYAGKTTHVNCGTAKATVKIGATVYEISGGQCAYDPSVGFAVNTGTNVIGTSDIAADGPQYFGVVLQPGSKGMAVGIVHGVSFVITDGSGTDTVIVAADRKSGSVTGTATTTDDTISATFTC